MVSNDQVKRKYNIIFLIDGLGMGGAERLMMPILRNLNRDYFEPRVCALQIKDGNPIADDLRALGIPVDLILVPYLRDVTALPRLYRYLKDVRADLVHTQLEIADILGNIAAKLLRLPSVATIHTMPSQDMKLKSRLHQDVELFALRYFSNVVVSVSEEARKYYLDISRIPAGKLLTIYNGIDLSHFENLDYQQERFKIRQEFGIPNDAKILVTVAVLREFKGIQFMIRALPSIVSEVPNAYYLLVGNGSHRDSLEQEADQAGVRDHIIFAGQRDDIPQLLAASDLFVLPTLTEALPTVLAEAMAARLPIVASAVGGVPEMVIDGENGLLLPPSDSEALATACISLMVDAERRKVMGEQGWQVVTEKFNIHAQVDKLKELYLNLIKQYEK
ncbi:MAG: glycosyltransferase [Anaerolineales bacterium]|nr:glycosyltransferase [Anaerolineales bacterium]